MDDELLVGAIVETSDRVDVVVTATKDLAEVIYAIVQAIIALADHVDAIEIADEVIAVMNQQTARMRQERERDSR